MSLVPNCTFCQSSSSEVQQSSSCSHDRIDHWLATAKRMAPLFFTSLGTGIGAIILGRRVHWRGHPLRFLAATSLLFMLGRASFAFGKDVVRLMGLKDAGAVRAITGIFNKINGTSIDARDVLSRREQRNTAEGETIIGIFMKSFRDMLLVTLSRLPCDEADKELIAWMQGKIKLLDSEENLSHFASCFFNALKEADSDLYSFLSKQGANLFMNQDFREAKGKTAQSNKTSSHHFLRKW